MPKNTEFIKSKDYKDGFKLLGNKRAFNLLEVGIIHHNLEVNNIGMQLITGFAQCAQNKDAKQYFSKGIDSLRSKLK